MAVPLVVVPKQTVAKIQAAISQIPIIFNALIIDDDVSMTLPLQAHHNSMPKVGLYGMACLAILAVVGFLAFYQPIQQHQVATELIGHKLSNSHFNASEYEQLQKTKDAAQQRSQFLDLTTKNYQPRVDVLKELTRLLPSDSWLDSIDVSNNRLVMSGESASATDLVVTLTKSRLFKEVAFIRPSTKNPQSGKEKFKIKADIVPAVE